MFKRIFKVFWCLVLILPMIASFWNEELMAKNWEVFAKITPLVILQNFLVLVIFGYTYYGITQAFPFLNWSWLSLFSEKREGETSKLQNIYLIPAEIKYFGLFFIVIFAVNLPRYVGMEETWFRDDTMDWRHGLRLSIIFGLAHCLVGVPLGAGLAITIVGLWFTHQYFIGGTGLSTVHHTAYNLIVLGIIFLGLVKKHVSSFDKKTRNPEVLAALAEIRGLATGQSERISVSSDTRLVEKAEALLSHADFGDDDAEELLEILESYEYPPSYVRRLENSSRLSQLKKQLAS